MKLASLFSGGKDSTYAMYKASEEHEVVCLLTIKSDNPDSYMFHTPNIDLTELQAKSIGLPLLTANTKGEKELELIDLKNTIKKAKDVFKIQGITTGALFSKYQASRIQKICDELGLKCINPLWQMNQEKYLKKLIENNFKVMIMAIAAEGFDESWLGKIIDEKTIEELINLKNKCHINVAGEGGEYESFVLNCPMFKQEIIINKSKKIMQSDNTGKLIISQAKLIK